MANVTFSSSVIDYFRITYLLQKTKNTSHNIFYALLIHLLQQNKLNNQFHHQVELLHRGWKHTKIYLADYTSPKWQFIGFKPAAPFASTWSAVDYIVNGMFSAAKKSSGIYCPTEPTIIISLELYKQWLTPH